MVKDEKKICFNKLCLDSGGSYGNDRLTGKYGGTLGNSVDV